MEVRFKEIHHLEEFMAGKEKFIKDCQSPRGNAIRRPGQKRYKTFSPDATVKRIVPVRPKSMV